MYQKNKPVKGIDVLLHYYLKVIMGSFIFIFFSCLISLLGYKRFLYLLIGDSILQGLSFDIPSLYNITAFLASFKVSCIINGYLKVIAFIFNINRTIK